MGNIVVSNFQLDYILMTDIRNMEELKVFLWSLYEEAGERLNFFEDNGWEAPKLAEFIPTKAMIMDSADLEFAEHYLHYIMNGHCKDGWEDSYRERVEEGENMYDLIPEMEEMRYQSTSAYMGCLEGAPELRYMRDIFTGLHLFNMTYLDDCANEDIYKKEITDGYRWVNPPLVKVW